MIENWIAPRPRPNRKIETPDQPEKEPADSDGLMATIQRSKNINRRKFLKLLGVGAAVGSVAVLSKPWLGNIIDIIKKKWNEDSEDEKSAFEEAQAPTSEQEKITDQDKQTIGETIEKQIRTKGKIELNRETKRALYQKWHGSYSPPEGENYLGLINAMKKMSPWVDEMKRAFAQAGVPDKYVYLAIPESHFDVKAVSRKSASGPFQFTYDTGKLYKLLITDAFDERCDPVSSASACARHLKESFERFNNNWDLALADYNGGYTNRYAKFRQEKRDRNYDDYLAWRERRLNDFIKNPKIDYKVKEKDTLSLIGDKYGISLEEIKKFNKKTGNGVKIGEVLNIPPTLTAMMVELSDSLENLNYPEKFWAILELIKKHDLEKTIISSARSRLNYSEFKILKSEQGVFLHTVASGEGLFAIARLIKKKNPSIKMSVGAIVDKLARENNLPSKKAIQPGMKLRLTLETKTTPSLKEIAIKNKLSIEKLEELNPAVLDSFKALPSNITIRLPK